MRSSNARLFILFAILFMGLSVEARPSERIAIAADGSHFIHKATGEPFVPKGFNYDRDYKFRLIEEYWDNEWSTVENDFREMRQLGANVIRIHLQFNRFMDSPTKSNKHALQKLSELLALAERTGLYLDLTGLACYRKDEVPAWYNNMDEKSRWAAQAEFWRAVAKCCRKSPAVFCYDLINEPFVPAKAGGDWIFGTLGPFSYVQAITREPGRRSAPEIASKWVSTMVEAVRSKDKIHLLTVGMLPNSADNGGPGFLPSKAGAKLDFIAVHLYPRSGHLAEDIDTLKKFWIGKPIVIEETFLMGCNAAELKQFLNDSTNVAAGWIGFYWGQTPEELTRSKNVGDAITRQWLEVFTGFHPVER